MQEQDIDGEPSHHARRPMNAFLIFCKRHRSVVRDKYPNLENRSITKILGEWWANLDKEEKECYTGLAKQYKDAFFSANPDFKWYKLPAPPLRTLSSRPRDLEKPPEPPHRYYEVELANTNNNSTKVDFNKKRTEHVYNPEPKPLSMFTPGKLADEANMGGLSSLLATKTENETPNPYYSPHKYKSAPISEDRSQNIYNFKHKPRENSILELQNALSETTRMFEDFDGDKNTRRYEYDQFTSQDVINKIVDKRYFKDNEYYHQYDDEDDKNSRSGRSCKGKRYQEFMAFGGLIVNKRQKRDNTDRMTDEYGAACSWDPDSCKSEDSNVTEELKHENFLGDTSAESEIKLECRETPDTDNNEHKTYTPADFDLDAKIRALPSLSLEKFQQRKRDNKRKKKTFNLKPKAFNSSEIINSVPHPVLDERREMAERWRENVIGSQKRKPRKVSITRLKINSMVSSSDRTDGHNISPEIKLATEAPCTVVHSMDVCRQPSQDVDLLALATLAEVAANTSRIEDPSKHQIMTAKASD